MARLEENARASDIQLHEQHFKQIDEVVPHGAVEGKRYAPEMMKIIKAFSQLLYPIAAVAKKGLGVCGSYGGDGLRQGWFQFLDDPDFDSA